MRPSRRVASARVAWPISAVSAMALMLAPAGDPAGASAQSASVAPSVGAHPGQGSAATPATGGPIWLSGPFGRLVGAAADREPATTPGTGTPLDVHAKAFILSIDVGREGDRMTSWTVTSTPLSGGGLEPVVLALDGPADPASARVDLIGPVDVGPHLLRADVVTDRGEARSAAWLIEVPDRDLPADGIPDIAAPDVRLSAGGEGAITGWQGSGCYVYACVEGGRPPRADRLAGVELEPGRPMELDLSDGSAVREWFVTAVPTAEAKADPVVLGAGATDGILASIPLRVLAAGDWLVTAEVVFDRERGWVQSYFRVVVP